MVPKIKRNLLCLLIIFEDMHHKFQIKSCYLYYSTPFHQFNQYFLYSPIFSLKIVLFDGATSSHVRVFPCFASLIREKQVLRVLVDPRVHRDPVESLARLDRLDPPEPL